MKLESFHSADDKRRWKIVSADEATGECSLHIGGETKTLSFGPGGIRICGRGR